MEVLPRKERLLELRTACAIAHGYGAGMSESELVTRILEHGLPPRDERERVRDARLAEGDNTTTSSSPEH